MSENSIQLIVGLGNPGQRYTETRHNAGVWFIEKLLDQFPATLRLESKFRAQITQIQTSNGPVRIAIPTTYMNESGIAVRAIAQFYKLQPEQILIAHDELDVPVGQCKLKKGGGAGGHNGLRSIHDHLSSTAILRLKIGIDRPNSAAVIADYVLDKPSKLESLQINEAIAKAVSVMPHVFAGKLEAAMTALHTV